MFNDKWWYERYSPDPPCQLKTCFFYVTNLFNYIFSVIRFHHKICTKNCSVQYPPLTFHKLVEPNQPLKPMPSNCPELVQEPEPPFGNHHIFNRVEIHAYPKIQQSNSRQEPEDQKPHYSTLLRDETQVEFQSGHRSNCRTGVAVVVREPSFRCFVETQRKRWIWGCWLEGVGVDDWWWVWGPCHFNPGRLFLLRRWVIYPICE